MLELKKNPKAKIGTLAATLLAFGSVWGVVQANQPLFGSTSQAAAEAVASLATATPAVQSQTVAVTTTPAAQQSSSAQASAVASTTTTTHTTTHVS